MATHEQNIENLRSAVYGEQVRGSMIELFEEDYKLVKNGLGVGTDVTSPSSSTEGYSDGNVYLNIETQDIWKLENEAWALKGNMKGIESIEYTPVSGDGKYNILEITLTDGSAPIVCRIKNGETGNGVESVDVISTVGNVKTYRMTFTDGTHYDWDVQEGGHVIADEEGTVMAQQPTVQFIGANVENDTSDPSNPVTKVTIPQGGHRIASTLPNGSIMPVGVKREVLEFDGFNVEDNPDPDHLSTVVHGQLKVSPTKTHWDALSQAEKDDPNTYWVRPWADTVAFATDKTPVGAVLSVATAKDGEVTDPVIHTPSGTFPTEDYLVCNGQSVPLNKYPALAKYFEDNFGSVYYFTATVVPGYFSLPNWSSDFPSNGVLVMKARESSNTITFAEIDDASVSEDKLWSSEKIDSEITLLSNINRRTRKNITSNLANLSAAVAEQNLAKYGYSIGDYFVGASGQYYILADMDCNYGGYNSYAVVGTHHIGIVVDSKQTSAWLSSGSVSSYSASTLHSFLSGTVLTNVKSDFKVLFGGSTGAEHLLARTELDNAIGGWGTTWTGLANCLICAMTEVQIYGSTVFSADGFQTGTGSKQLEVFKKFRFNEIYGNISIWLKSLFSASEACFAANDGYASSHGVTIARRASGLILFY